MGARVLRVELGARRQGVLFGQECLGGFDGIAWIDGGSDFCGAPFFIGLVRARSQVVAIETFLLRDDFQFLGDAVELVGIKAMPAPTPDDMHGVGGSTDRTIFSENAHL